MALKVLFGMDMNTEFSVNWMPYAKEAFLLEKEYEAENKNDPPSVDPDEPEMPFQSNSLLGQLVTQTVSHLREIEEAITKAADNWPLDRINFMDKNILRLGTAELLYCEGIPPKVTLNEWIEVTKRYSTDDSPKFINGILDKIAKDANKSSDIV